MTDERSQRFEQDLTTVLRQEAGDGAPASLRYRLADVTATPPLERRSWFAPPLRWAAAAVAVVAVAVLAFLMIPHENVGPAPTSSAQPSASTTPPSGEATPSGEASPTASPSVLPTPVPTPAPVAWSSLSWSQGVPAPGNVLDVVAWGDGYVGVGSTWGVAAVDAAFFTSPDGVHWSRTAQMPTDGDVWAQWVVRVGNRLLAIGSVDWQGASPDYSPPLWVSTDGRTWIEVNSPSWDAALTQAFRGSVRLMSGPGGVMAVRMGTDPVVLFSPDGSTWTRATVPATERVIAKDVVASSSGFVIVGRDGEPDTLTEVCESTCPPPGTGRPAAWTSADGIHWAEAAVEGTAAPGGELRKVLPMRAGLVALGVDSSDAVQNVGPLSTWISTDGLSWLLVRNGNWPIGTGEYLPVVAADGEHAIVFGWAPEGSDLAAWTSTDGVRWTRLSFIAGANAPVIDCGRETCVRMGDAWIEPDRVIVMAAGDATATTAGTAELFWMATPGS